MDTSSWSTAGTERKEGQGIDLEQRHRLVTQADLPRDELAGHISLACCAISVNNGKWRLATSTDCAFWH